MPSASTASPVRDSGPGPNWALWLGGLLVAGVAALALWGPSLAPADPLKENYIVFIGRDFVKPPFAPLLVPGFPLGADEFGRDIYSRLLWAVRPTLTLVLTVAALRLSLGLGAGLVAGWSNHWVGRVLSSATAVALAAPVLFVALFVIAATGQRWGVGAFILGLALTGWADVARLVREQTRLVKGQRYVEAAEALGASEAQILSRHVLPQLLPLVWILLALEASSALLTTAGLGFLGYFVNAVWLPTEHDFAGVRAAGLPELGQLLNFSATTRQPWAALMAGGLVLVTVLGFNLLGAGLRQAFSAEHQRLNWVTRRLAHWSDSLGDRFFLVLAEWQRAAGNGAAIAGLLILIGGGGWWLWRQTNSGTLAANAISVPGGHLWAGARHDAAGTLYAPVRGPAAGEIAWTFTEAGGLFPPAVAADGTLYLVTARDGGSLAALSPAGALLWQTPIPEADYQASDEQVARPALPFFASVPALTAAGEIIVVTGRGDAHAFGPGGALRWSWLNRTPSNLLAQPFVGSDGSFYFATERHIIALTGIGELRWRVNLPTYSYSLPVLRQSPDGRLLSFQDVLLSAADGSRLLTAPLSIDLFIFGADGGTYLRKQSVMEAWEVTETDAQITPRIRLDERGLGLNFGASTDAGVLPDGRAWFMYAAPFGGPGKLIWSDASGQQVEVVNSPRAGSQALAIDQNRVVYLCDMYVVRPVRCSAYRPDGTSVWETDLEAAHGFVVGAALAPDRLYVATSTGALLALGPAAAP